MSAQTSAVGDRSMVDHVADELVRHRGIPPLTPAEKEVLEHLNPKLMYAPDPARLIREAVAAADAAAALRPQVEPPLLKPACANDLG